MKKPLLFIAAACLVVSANAQYNFSTFTESYQPLENSIEIVENDQTENVWDDPEFVVDLGFDFMFGNQSYSEIQQVGGGALIGFENAESVSIFGYASDLIDGEMHNPASVSTISYLVDGAVGSRIFKLQYENCAFYNEVNPDEGIPNSLNRVNFQIWFYEGLNAMEIRFGPHSITDSELVHDGGPGPAIYLVVNLDVINETFEYAATLSGPPSSPTVVPMTNIEAPTGLDDNPNDGRVYRYTPTSVGVNEISMSNLKLYPTQADQTIFIDGLETPNEKYQIVDITGKIQMTGLVNQNEAIDVSKLTSGLYLLQVEGYSDALKFVKL